MIFSMMIFFFHQKSITIAFVLLFFFYRLSVQNMKVYMVYGIIVVETAVLQLSENAIVGLFFSVLYLCVCVFVGEEIQCVA